MTFVRRYVGSSAQMGAGVVTSAIIADGGILDVDVNAAAAIAKSKLAALAITDADVAAGAAIAKSKLAALGIVNADIDAAAAIAASKLSGVMLSAIANPTTVTPVSGTPRTPSATRPTFVTLIVRFNSSTVGATAKADIDIGGHTMAQPPCEFQNPLTAGTYEEDKSVSFIVPPNVAYTVTMTLASAPVVVLKAEETTL